MYYHPDLVCIYDMYALKNIIYFQVLDETDTKQNTAYLKSR